METISHSFDGCLILGDYKPDRDGTDVEAFLRGKYVTMFLNNGAIITGVKLGNFEYYLGERRFTYRLPGLGHDSKVTVKATVALYVHYKLALVPKQVAGTSAEIIPSNIHVGEVPPEIRGNYTMVDMSGMRKHFWAEDSADAIEAAAKQAQETGQPVLVKAQEGPHSRACGFEKHDHGPACSDNCPTCGKNPNPISDPVRRE